MIQSIKLNNLLSFGESAEAIELGPLNIIIGPNGSGKSNFLEAIDLLKNAPDQISKPIREGGGVSNWLWKGRQNNRTPTASLDVVLNCPGQLYNHNLRYVLSFLKMGPHFEIFDERIETKKLDQQPSPHYNPCLYYHYNSGFPVLNVKGEERSLQKNDMEHHQSILAQLKDPDQYPEITYLGKTFGKISLYREWNFGRYTAPRIPQKADAPNDILEPDSSNLGLVLNRFEKDPTVKKRLLDALRMLYDGIDNYSVQIEGGTVQVFLQEGNFTVPATRLSDGTLRYLCLLAILCNPTPPPLICIEEPELGLHPDILPTLAELLKEASSRTQLIITTHSDILVDAMTDQPDSILVCEKNNEGTVFTRLNADDLKPWLEKYRLGELWTRGEIGGMRW